MKPALASDSSLPLPVLTSPAHAVIRIAPAATTILLVFSAPPALRKKKRPLRLRNAPLVSSAPPATEASAEESALRSSATTNGRMPPLPLPPRRTGPSASLDQTLINLVPPLRGPPNRDVLP